MVAKRGRPWYGSGVTTMSFLPRRGRVRVWVRLVAGACLWLAGLSGAAESAPASSCVWKVTSPEGHTLYLAGSIHVLRREDYPLPASYDQALAASAGVAFETDLIAMSQDGGETLKRAALLPKNVTLRDKVDPRTYAYVMRVASQVKGGEPEKQLDHLRPWAIAMQLTAPGFEGVSSSHGVELYVLSKARAAHKATTGLVPLKQHIAVFGAMSDTDGEIYLLREFIHLDTRSEEFKRTVAAWKRGDAEGMWRDFSDTPTIRQRLLTDRNVSWMPKIEGFLRSGKTWMVVAGAAHMGGPEGLPALLQARGYRVEQM